MVPERNLLGYFYPAFRANMGIQFGGVLVVDDTAVVPWELPAFEWSWHEPLDRAARTCSTRTNLHGGMWLRCLEPGRVFRFGCENDDLSFDLTFEAALPAAADPPGAAVQPRRPHRPARSGHRQLHAPRRGSSTSTASRCATGRGACAAPAANPRWATTTAPRRPTTASSRSRSTAGATTASALGYLLRDGVWSNLVDGHRTVERDAEHRPARIEIEAVDELGRTLHATGRPVSRCVFNAYPHMFCWTSLTEWDVDGVRCWGEDQDVWHPGKWRRFVLGER